VELDRRLARREVEPVAAALHVPGHRRVHALHVLALAERHLEAAVTARGVAHLQVVGEAGLVGEEGHLVARRDRRREILSVPLQPADHGEVAPPFVAAARHQLPVLHRGRHLQHRGGGLRLQPIAPVQPDRAADLEARRERGERELAAVAAREERVALAGVEPDPLGREDVRGGPGARGAPGHRDRQVPAGEAALHPEQVDHRERRALLQLPEPLVLVDGEGDLAGGGGIGGEQQGDQECHGGAPPKCHDRAGAGRRPYPTRGGRGRICATPPTRRRAPFASPDQER